MEIEKENGLKAKDIMDKVRGVCSRSEHNRKGGEALPSEFIELLRRYPQSLCTRKMSDKLKLLIALIHEENPESSYEDLSDLFVRSKASIFEAIHEKGTEARKILENKLLNVKAHDIALAELVEEEKKRILLEKSIESKETNERTAIRESVRG